MFKIFITEEFERIYKKLDTQLQREISKEIAQQEAIDKIRVLIPYYRDEIKKNCQA